MPLVCGAVDGTLIPILATSRNEEQFVDRHGDHSLTVDTQIDKTRSTAFAVYCALFVRLVRVLCPEEASNLEAKRVGYSFNKLLCCVAIFPTLRIVLYC